MVALQYSAWHKDNIIATTKLANTDNLLTLRSVLDRQELGVFDGCLKGLGQRTG